MTVLSANAVGHEFGSTVLKPSKFQVFVALYVMVGICIYMYMM